VTAKEPEGVEVHRGVVVPEWIDINNHMNVAYYVLAFDQGIDSVWQDFGITDDYIREQNNSTFAVEAHVMYRRELRLDDPYIVTTQVLAFDAKRLHQFQRMYHATEGYLAASAEWMNLHVDMGTRRVSPWPVTILDGIRNFAARHADTAMPGDAGRRMRIEQPQWQSGGYMK